MMVILHNMMSASRVLCTTKNYDNESKMNFAGVSVCCLASWKQDDSQSIRCYNDDIFCTLKLLRTRRKSALARFHSNLSDSTQITYKRSSTTVADSK